MGEKTQGIKIGTGGIGYSLGSNAGLGLGSSGYSLGKTGSGSAYSATNIKGYASSVSPVGNKEHGSSLFKNKGARAYGLYAAINPVLHYAKIIDVVEEELKRYRKKLYDLVGMVSNSHYRFN